MFDTKYIVVFYNMNIIFDLVVMLEKPFHKLIFCGRKLFRGPFIFENDEDEE